MEEPPQEDDLDGSAMAEDDGGFLGDAAVSSTAVSPEPIPIPAPVRVSMRTQQAVKGHGTKDHLYKLDFTPAICGTHGSSSGTCCKWRDH